MKKIILLGIALIFLVSACSLNSSPRVTKISPEEAKTKAEDYINNVLMQGGNAKATVENLAVDEKYPDLYKMTVKIEGNDQEFTSYITVDGKRFFATGQDIEDEEKKQEERNANRPAQPSATVSNKSDKPKVELFVMSYCPFGTQIEKGILPVLETLGDKIDFNLEFCDYVMHGDKETKENLRQYCIQKEQPQKLQAYLGCFLDSQDSDKCLKEANVDVGKLKQCTDKTDKEYNVTNNTEKKGRFPVFPLNQDNAKKYGVAGSPTLIINGEKISSGRSPKALLEAICSAFNNPPEECNKELSADNPSPGFGSGTSGSGANGGCGG